MEKIIVLGQGGHARSMIDTIEKEGKYKIVGYVVNEPEEKKDKYSVIGTDDDLEEIYCRGIKKAVIGIGYLGKGNLRRNLYNRLKEIGYELPVICDPSAIIASDTHIEEGTFIGKGVIVNAGAQIKRMCIINTGAIVEHDCIIGDFSHIAVGTVLCGAVTTGEEVFVGANATIIQGRSIGKKSIVGAGTVIRKNVESNCIICDQR